MTEFAPWPKTPRLFRDVVITEKIDGTNAAVHIERVADYVEDADVVEIGEARYRLVGQSRKRLIHVGDDNFGFAAYVREHAYTLATTLGEGVHYGEWWGSGIQRGYGLTGGEKRFSLFNVHRYAEAVSTLTEGNPLGVVPVLYRGPFSTDKVTGHVEALRLCGSKAAPGFMRPEGVITYHSASRSVFKTLLDNDDTAKGE